MKKYVKASVAFLIAMIMLMACLILPENGPLVTDVFADDGDPVSYTITYDANGGTFEDGSTTNAVTYSQTREDITKIVHTPNWSDDGTYRYALGSYTKYVDTVTIPGATSLHVELKYGTFTRNSVPMAKVYVMSGETSVTADTITSTAPDGTLYTLSGSNTGTNSYDIEGDAVSFGWWSGNWYSSSYSRGYYAVVTANGAVSEVQSGEYLVPTTTMPHYALKGWTTSADGSGRLYKTEELASASFSSDTVLYAQYGEDIVASSDWWKIYRDGTLSIGQDGTTIDNPLDITSLGYDYNWTQYDWDTVETNGVVVIKGSGNNGRSIQEWFDYWYFRYNPYKDVTYNVTGVSAFYYYQMSDLENYDWWEKDYYYAPVGTEFTLSSQNSYGWDESLYASLEDRTVTVTDTWQTIDFYHDRLTYQVQFDPNCDDATGTMDAQTLPTADAVKLNPNAFEREGYMFIGWNLKADGTGDVTYKDKGLFYYELGEDETSVTLYAQWIPMENITFVDGVATFKVYCHGDETIVIPNLPAGVTYEVKETGMRPGWFLDEQDQTEGSVVSVYGAQSFFTNDYSSEGQLSLNIYKTVIDSITGKALSFDEGQFTFALYTEPAVEKELKSMNLLAPMKAVSDSLQRIDIQANAAVDTNEYIYDDDGNQIPNPHYGQAQVAFEPIDFDLWDLSSENRYSGQDFVFWISEVNVPEGYEAPDPIEVHVHAYDGGDGIMKFDITYLNEDGQEIEPVVVNKNNDGAAVTIQKVVQGEGPADAEFAFRVDVLDESGKTYLGEIVGAKTTDNDVETLQISSGETVTMRADQTVTVRIPDGMTYTITELDKDGWSLISTDGNTGTVQAGEAYTATFTNAYEVNGLAEVNIHKTLEGRDLNEGEFRFEMVDSDENLIGVATNDADGNAKIQVAYTNDDIGNTYTYTLREVVPEGAEGNGITYDTVDREVTITVRDNNGVMAFDITVDGESTDTAEFLNKYGNEVSVTLNGKKVLEGRDFRESDEWTFNVTPTDGGPAADSVTIHPYENDEFEISIPFTTADLNGESEKEFTYEITESGSVALVANDKTVWTVKILVKDNGNGHMTAEVIEGDTEMTFTNKALVTLPSTGSNTAVWLMLIGLVVIGVGIVYAKKGRKELTD